MSFLSPITLLLAAAGLVPLLLHLRRGRVTRVIEFPGARYLARATQEHQRALRVRNSLLLLVQLAIVILVALAAARPLARIGTGHAPSAVAIVLDNSMSSGVVSAGKPVLDRLVGAARDVLAQSSAQDRLWLVTADGTTTEGDARALGAVLDTLHALEGAGSPRAATTAAWVSVSRVSGATPTLAVVTDGQRTTWRERPHVGGTVSVFTPLGTPASRGVVEAVPRPARWSGSGSVHLVVRSADSVPFRIALDERTAARGMAPPDGAVDVAVASTGAGWIVGRVEIPRDELAADDVRWFAVWQGAAPAVEARAGAFVANAVNALIGAGTLRPGTEVSIVAADEIRSRPALIVAPPEAGRVGAANLALARADIPWRFGAERRSEALARGPGVSASVRLRYALVPASAAPAETLATVGGEPWIVAGNGYVLVASALDTAATNLPATAEFVPWLARTVVDRLAPGGGPVAAASPGSTIAAPRGADSLTLAGAPGLPVRDSVTLPPRAGVYFWTHGARRIGAVVVNAEPEESDLRRETDAELAAHFAPASVRVTHDAGAFARDVYGAASRRPVAAPLIVGALALLLVESLFAGVRPRSSAAARHPKREAA